MDAAEEDITLGKSNHADKECNRNNDQNADDGVLKVGGKRLLRFAKWLSDRHQRYKSFIG